jgi:16S rRNA (cytosine967-C5)-methyltransferase
VSPGAAAGGRTTPRAVALEALGRIGREDFSIEAAVDRAGIDSLGEADRGLAFELVHGVVRNRAWLDAAIGQKARRDVQSLTPVVRDILGMALYQVEFLDRVPDHAAVFEAVDLAKRRAPRGSDRLVNAVLRAFLRDRTVSLPDRERDPVGWLAVLYSHPAWMVRRWVGRLGPEETERLLKANNARPPLVLRANRLRTTREALLSRLAESGIPFRPGAYSPDAVILDKGGARPDRLPGWGEGLFTVQDEGAQMISLLVDPQPGERILDACAAPGGKALHLAALMGNKGEIAAADPSAERLELLRRAAERLGASSVRPVASEAAALAERLGGAPFDRILVDAPCSGTGVLRRHPEGKWRKEEGIIGEFSALQRKILSAVAPLLKTGGRLVFATCSLEPEEGEDAARWVGASLEGLVLVNVSSILRAGLPAGAGSLATDEGFLRTWPHRHGTDGFFAAVWEKRGASFAGAHSGRGLGDQG